MKTYNICGNTFEVLDAHNGITVSGGADSALVLYFLLKYATTPVHIFTLACLGKQNTSTRATINVISMCAELTGNYNFIQHITYATTQDLDILLATPKKYLENRTIQMLYSGQTKNPPNSVSDAFGDFTTQSVERNPEDIRPHHIGPHYLPWTNLDKRDIFKIYKEYNLMDNLFTVTRSCEWQPNMYSVGDPGDEHCGECWWCEERQWGFNKLR